MKSVWWPNISGQERLRRIVNEDSSAWGCFSKIDGPNIHGTVDGYQALETATGAFSIDNMAGSPVGTEVMKNHRFLFNASLYSTMYQDGATVQAPALSALPCIRY